MKQSQLAHETIWIHGAGLSADTWQGRAQGLCLNLPGHGGLPRCEAATVAAFADHLMEFLPKDDFHLVGHSLGGMVAMELAARRRRQVRALVLAETGFAPQGGVLRPAATELVGPFTRWLGPKGIARLTGMGQSKPVKSALRSITAMMEPEALVDAMRASQSFDARGFLGKLTMPTLILAGRRTPRTLPQSRSLAQSLPDARLMVLKGGHFLHIDAPESFYGTIRAFLKANS